MSKKAKESLPVFNRDTLLDALSAKILRVDDEELGGTILLKELDALQQIQMNELRDTLQNTQKDNIQFMCQILAMVLVDENGQPLFTESEVEILAKSKLKSLNKVFMHALDLNGMTAKAAEEIEGNLEPEPTSGSPTN